MYKKLLPLLSLLLALTVVVVMAGSVFAHIAPSGASSNNLNIGISRPSGVYYVGDTIHYVVTVSVPLNPPGGGKPCYQTGMNTYFTSPHDLVLPAHGPQIPTFTFPLIPELLPGESVTFTSTGTFCVIYSPTGVNPTRAQLAAGDAAMPASPNFTTSSTVYPGGSPIVTSSFPGLNYVVNATDLINNPHCIAFDRTSNTGGSHDYPVGNDSAADEASISTSISSPDTVVAISAAKSNVLADNSTTLTLSESNTGNVALTAAHVVVDNGTSNIADLNCLSPGFSSSGNTDSILDVGETWTWTGLSTGPLTADTTFTATGHGTSPGNHDITYPAYPAEQASVVVTVTTSTPPLPELPAGLLFGLGLVGIVGYVGIKRRTSLSRQK